MEEYRVLLETAFAEFSDGCPSPAAGPITNWADARDCAIAITEFQAEQVWRYSFDPSSSAVDAILLDTQSGDRIGGTGQVHDWAISRRIVEALDSRVLLAGGLRPDNLAAAIEQVQPFGVDVNSGVEFQNGEKDPEKVAAFVRLAKCGSAAIP